MKGLKIYILLYTLVSLSSIEAQSNSGIKVGAEQFEKYLPLLKDKQVALVVNPTSLVDSTHLVDVLLSQNIDIKTIFAPEHGFRGDADAGEAVHDGKDPKTGLPIISLYGNNKKPSSAQLKEIDIVVFDIQDVGVRFYTYISTMHYVMEACAQNKIPLLILDRPNPNGHYIDGPILEKEFTSFVGMHPIPIVHGLTVGELAQMINGERWLKNRSQCMLTVIPVEGWNHNMPYSLPVKPSPNLPNDEAINLYPSLCFFEATEISVGRGTYTPFQVIGSPLSKGPYAFTPTSIEGMAKHPKHENEPCFGYDLRETPRKNAIDLSYLIKLYQEYPNQSTFFMNSNFFNLLAGNASLQEQIKAGLSENEIRESWKEDLTNYKKMRLKYLIYP